VFPATMITLCLLLVLAVAHASLPRFHRERPLFQHWMLKYNKRYTDQEYEIRLQNFAETRKRVEQQNLRSRELNSTATFALNKFADLTPAEFSKLLGTKGFNTQNSEPKKVASLSGGPPAEWDWTTRGGITGQKDELQCGSCWAMTVAMAIESAYMIHKGKHDQQPLSTQQIVDCDTNDGGCNGGMPTTAYQYVVSVGGLETDAEYPYNGVDGTCNVTKAYLQDPITGYQLAIPAGSLDEVAMANFLATNQPISTAVDASSWQSYSGGVLMADQCTQNIDHGVQIVAYKGLDKTGYWVIRNMWGSDWGENGFIRLQFGANTCGLTSLPTAPTLP